MTDTSNQINLETLQFPDSFTVYKAGIRDTRTGATEPQVVLALEYQDENGALIEFTAAFHPLSALKLSLAINSAAIDHMDDVMERVLGEEPSVPEKVQASPYM